MKHSGDLLADNKVLKKLADGLVCELTEARRRMKNLQKSAIEQGLVLDGVNVLNKSLRTQNIDLENLVNNQKDEIHELTATLTSSQLEALSKGSYIDKYMKPLKDGFQKERRKACVAEEIIRLVIERLNDHGAVVWARGEILGLIHETTQEVENND
jgi:hypothetical protein